MTRVLIIGAGPAGLAAAYELVRNGASVTVLEKLGQVGGLSRTMKHDGCLFDIGPHRFFTKNDEVRQFYTDVLAGDVVTVRRLTRILYKNRLFNYPLTPVNVVTGLGVGECANVLADYAFAQMRQFVAYREAETFEDWVTQRFGTRLFEAFFKTYTEKVWGMPCASISADWAAQRIKSLSLPQAVRNPTNRGVRASRRPWEHSDLAATQLTHHEARYGDIGRSLVRQKSVLQALAMLKAMAEA